ncbi:dolichyl-diphosphooligosaccharide--protein glycosyltransferase subunit 4A-like [Quillaja saponaria]|uniref:Dolichyl-diphosphooligosaccharide--protein glycosyltransferase subunit 4A-like n=1 Tax=Quillaja saponaria TaxID=32244 RepID=A0AAD7P8X3_QUISA|nr:dolichyl-diphosphooligosaccharide--protein glycosyltransferase subunit 4A-like [Quillaja saponaria]
MIDDQDLGFFANFLGIFIFVLLSGSLRPACGQGTLGIEGIVGRGGRVNCGIFGVEWRRSGLRQRRFDDWQRWDGRQSCEKIRCSSGWNSLQKTTSC